MCIRDENFRNSKQSGLDPVTKISLASCLRNIARDIEAGMKCTRALRDEANLYDPPPEPPKPNHCGYCGHKLE